MWLDISMLILSSIDGSCGISVQIPYFYKSRLFQSDLQKILGEWDMWWLHSCYSHGLLMPRHPRNVEAHDPGRPSFGLRWDLGKHLYILSMHLLDYSFQYSPRICETIIFYHEQLSICCLWICLWSWDSTCYCWGVQLSKRAATLTLSVLCHLL